MLLSLLVDVLFTTKPLSNAAVGQRTARSATSVLPGSYQTDKEAFSCDLGRTFE